MAGDPISVEEARRVVRERAEAVPRETESVPIGEALGRVLAERVAATEPNPPFDNSAMDGFAVRAADTGEGVKLKLVGESRAGAPARNAVGKGEAIAISTGAMMPEGADAVIPIEDVAAAGESEIEVGGTVAEGRHRRLAGEDIEAGAEVLAAGAALGPPEIGALARVGRSEVICATRPSLSIVVTGDELAPAGQQLGPGQIRDSNAASLAALAATAGAAPGEALTVGDDRDATTAALAAGLESDILVTSGGISVGEHDHVKPALAALEVEEIFWGVALRPGKPTWFGIAPQGALVFGLPGNPVSAMVTFTLFVRPAIRALLGAGDIEPARATAAVTEAIPLLAARMQAVRCALELGDDGWRATPTGPQGSHVLTSMLGADCLAFVPAGEGELAAGEHVPFEWLRR